MTRRLRVPPLARRPLPRCADVDRGRGTGRTGRLCAVDAQCAGKRRRHPLPPGRAPTRRRSRVRQSAVAEGERRDRPGRGPSAGVDGRARGAERARAALPAVAPTRGLPHRHRDRCHDRPGRTGGVHRGGGPHRSRVAAVYPNVWLYEGGLATETLALLWVATLIWLAYRYRGSPGPVLAVALGAVVGAAAMTRAGPGRRRSARRAADSLCPP